MFLIITLTIKAVLHRTLTLTKCVLAIGRCTLGILVVLGKFREVWGKCPPPCQGQSSVQGDGDGAYTPKFTILSNGGVKQWIWIPLC